MLLKRTAQLSETQKKRSLLRRMVIIHGFLLVCGLTLIARLIQLQIIDRSVYSAAAQAQHYGGVKLPAQRGDIYALNSKTGDKTILATDTTLDLVYVDPYVTPDPAKVADMLSNILVTQQFYDECSQGKDQCPQELISFNGSPFAEKFNPLSFVKSLGSGALLEPLPAQLPTSADAKIPDITEVRRLFARDIQDRISQKRVTFVPIKYSVTKQEADAVQALGIPGITVNADSRLIWADPEQIDQGSVPSIGAKLAVILNIDASTLQSSLRSRALRYVPIMRKLPPDLSLQINEAKLQSLTDTNQQRAKVSRGEADSILDPYGGVALLPESWRYYPDPTVASQVVGFMNQDQQAQYGIERTFDTQLRGKEGLISTVSDLQGGQILTSNQTIVDAQNGDSVILTIDPFIQKQIEQILAAGVQKYNADSGQAIVMDPYTGRIIAMANAPLFDRNDYASVYDKVPISVPPDKQKNIVVEIYNPDTNAFVVRDYMNNILTDSGRTKLPQDIQTQLSAIQQNYDLKSIARYYLYLGENARIEIFPTGVPDIWLKYQNNIGVGAYLNDAIQQIYEPGSVMKPITMSIALDQGEVTPDTVYDDEQPVKVDQYTINNALHKFYGKVNMSTCLAWSINTCLTNVSARLGSKLFQHELLQFGFGRVTGVDLNDELSGDIKPWQKWSLAGLATAAFGQGVSVTPLQMITAFSALANGGKIMKPTIVDSVIHPDGTVDKSQPTEVNQVITPETSDTITAMLVYDTQVGWAKSGVVKGYSMAAKTGTSQIAGPGGRYEAGTGSTVGTYMGFGPVPHPKFILLVKLDRAKNMQTSFGETTAAPLWHDIAQFLFQYYDIPPIGATK